MTDNDTTYNEWTNRETWAANLWITNDQGLYESVRERLELRLLLGDMSARRAGETLKEWWDELTDPDEELMDAREILKMVRDVGQEDAINWEEIAAGLMDE